MINIAKILKFNKERLIIALILCNFVQSMRCQCSGRPQWRPPTAG